MRGTYTTTEVPRKPVQISEEEAKIISSLLRDNLYTEARINLAHRFEIVEQTLRTERLVS